MTHTNARMDKIGKSSLIVIDASAFYDQEARFCP